MNALRMDFFRRRLLALADRLKGDVAALKEAALRSTGGESSGSLSNAPLHLADLANDTNAQEVAVGLLRNEQEALLAIAAALDRLDAGTYGVCARCGQEIPEERLLTLPQASRCVRCEEKEEKDGGAPSGPAD
jgi:RNA polymerase-binding transcription factor DksA